MPASIFSETELARLASFPEEIPGDDLIRAFTLTGVDRDLVAIRGGSKPLGARASALCTSLPRLRSAQFERSSAIGRLLCRGPARGQPGRDSILRSTRGDAQSCLLGSRGLPAPAASCRGLGRWNPLLLRWPAIPRSRLGGERDRAPKIFRPRKGPHFLHLDLGPVLTVRVEGHLVYGFVTRPMSSTRSSSTRRTPLATPRSSSPCFIFWGCSSPRASGTWALSACIVSMLLRKKKGSRFC